MGPKNINADEEKQRSGAAGFPNPVAIGDLAAPMTLVLEHLTKALRYARDVQCDPWEFAVEIERLLSLGATTSDLRWLVKKGCVEHACEVTKPDDAARRFNHPRNLAFTEKSCFVLAGVAQPPLPGEAATADVAAVATPNAWAPRWDADDRTLYVGRFVVKEYRVRSPNQEAVLSAFEEEGWPHYIDDPLPPAGEQSPKQRLRDTIKCMNGNQKHRLIRFRGDGTGERVRWEMIAVSSDD